jgi:Ca2+-binding RTX toxin-like protein
MKVSPALNQLSKLALVAADQSYLYDAHGQLQVHRGDPLAELADTPSYEFRLPYTVEPGFVVDQVGEDIRTGFKFAALRNNRIDEVIVAMAGTDGANLQDWAVNMKLGWDQWDKDGGGRSLVFRYLNDLRDQQDNNKPFTGKIHFTGQSLGGALAQYAALEFFESRKGGELDVAQRITLTTFNALGARDGLVRYGNKPADLLAAFDAGFANADRVAHYYVTNDLISRLGGGHIGGSEYRLNFASDRFDPKTGEALLINPLEAHRIETGFYREFARRSTDWSGADFTLAEKRPVDLIDTANIQPLAAEFVALFNNRATTQATAEYRLKGSLIVALKDSDPADVARILDPTLDALFGSGAISPDVYHSLKREGVAFLRAASNTFARNAGHYLLTALAMEKANLDSVPSQEDIETVRQLLGPAYVSNDLGAAFYGPGNAARMKRNMAVLNANAVIYADNAGDRDMLARLGATPEEVRRITLTTDPNGDGLGTYLFNRLTQGEVSDAARIFGQLAKFWAEQKLRTAKATLSNFGDLSTASQVLYEEVTAQTVALITDVARGIGNAFTDFSRKATGVIFDLQRVLNFQELKIFRDSILGAEQVEAGNPDAWNILHQARLDIERAGAAVVVALQGSPDPFSDLNFDPNTSSLSLGRLEEGSVQVFTAYLPYEAGAGGQKIRFQLAGAAADKLTVWDEEIELDADGAFVLTVAEGQRVLSFAVAASEDVDNDEVLTLSATLVTLVDGTEVATHLPHEEATLTLDGQDESAPSGGLELHGDWGLKLYPVTYDGQPILDSNGNPIYETRADPRYPHRMNLERDPNGRPDFGEQSHPLTGLDGPDHIWLGEFGGAGEAFGLGGDDYFEGFPNAPNRIVGDHLGNFLGYSGNDTIEGGENLQPYSSPGFTREREHIEGIGDDILIGGLGDDEIYADRIALLDEALDPHTPELDQKGDWITGEQGDDRIFGSAAHDALFGGGGADVIRGGAGNDVVDGDDNYYNWGDAWWEVDPGLFGVTFFPVVNVRAPSDFEYYKDFGGDDVLDGGAGEDLIFGMVGQDVLIGGPGEDRLEGWEGDDQLFGGADDDTLVGDFGRNEQPWTRRPGADYRVMPGAVGLFSGDAGTVDQVGDDYLAGGAGDDELFGEGGADVLLGEEGDDVLEGDAGYLADELHGADLLDGGPGADSLAGHGGNDRLYGGPGADQLSGGEGNDDLSGGTENDVLYAGEGDDTLSGDAGADQLYGEAGSDSLRGGEGDDELDGGDGQDTLFADGGGDRLEGGEGDDALYGGAGEDVLSGGAGDDLIDGGSGIDIVRGGLGDDTYVLSLGYGRDFIEDPLGNNRFRFGAGIAPDRISAELDSATLAATLNYGFGADAAEFDITVVQIVGAEFADGTLWSRKDLLRVVPALATEGSSGAEAIAGNPFVRNELRGMGGDDSITGSANDDLLDGGDGADELDGAAGADVYFFSASESGIDSVSDSAIEAQAYLDWFYGKLGISDWMERGQHGGKYRVGGDGDSGTRYYDSYEQAVADFPFATITFVEPLPTVAPLVRRDDAAAIDVLIAEGIVSPDLVEFAAGLTLSDLTVTVTVDAAEAVEHPEQPWFGGGTLAVRWADAGFDLDVPGVTYGFAGSNLLTADISGYRLGKGIEGFRFADGTTYTLEQVLRQAEVVEMVRDYAFTRGSGTQLISRHYPNIVFDSSITPDDIAVSRHGTDLLITVNDGSAQGRIVGWYADVTSMPSTSLKFDSGEEVDAATLTSMGLNLAGSEADETLFGLDDFDDVLSGGPGNDVLDGGGGKDTYVFNRGDGVDTITEMPSEEGDPYASVILLPDIYTWELQSVRLGSLIVDLGNGDAIRFTGFDPDDPYATPVFDRIEFLGGRVITYDEVLDGVIRQEGTEEDDFISGTAVDDWIQGGGGNDSLFGGDGEDNLEGGEGNDMLSGGPGQDGVSGGEGSDTYLYAVGDGYDYVFDWDETSAGLDAVRFAGGIAPGEVRVTRDDYSYHLVLDGGDRLILDSAAREDAAEIERIEFGDGTVWSPADLAARVELLPGTEFDDAFWGTMGADVIEGLGGYDALFGNGGDDLLIGGEAGDFYYFAAGDGADVVDNLHFEGSWDQIWFAHASSTDVTLARSGDNLILRVGDGSDRVTLYGWYADANRKIDSVTFGGDGAHWDAATLEQLAPLDAGNSPPELQNPLPDLEVNDDSSFIFTVAPDAFSDPDVGDRLTYVATLADGSELPPWLSFDSDTGRFSGTPLQADVGSLDVQVVATDAGGLSASDDFTLTVINVNDAPMLEVAMDDQAAIEDEAFSYAVPAGTFADVDKNDMLVYTAARSDGSELPGWLTFANGAFAGTPRNADVGPYDIRVIATDSAGAAVSDVFCLHVANVNDTPVVANPIGEHSFEAGSAFSFALPANTFADEDMEDALNLSAALFGDGALPSWLTFNPATAIFSGNPGKKENGISHVVVTATDAAGASVAAGFGLVIGANAGSTVTGSDGDDVTYGGTGNEVLIAKGGHDTLFGGAGNDLIHGGTGRDVLQGGEGSDMLHGGNGQNLLDGGAGNDFIFGGRDSSLIVGGTGNDIIRTGQGSDVILFNRGDGTDTVFSDSAGDNTLSFGAGIRYSDLSLSRSGKDLVVEAGGNDRVVLKNWYNGKRSVSTLQFVLEEDYDAGSTDPLYNGKVHGLDFLQMVSAFDQARNASPGLTSWEVTNALLQFHLWGADDMALGGDLAYWYAKHRGMGGISLTAAQEVIGAPGFGSDAQSLRPFAGLQEGFVKLV